MRYLKQLDKLLDQEIKDQIKGLDEEKIFKELGIFQKKKKPNPIRTWSIRICYSLALVIISAILSITIYSSVQSNQYGDTDDIIQSVSEIFYEEMKEFGENKQLLCVKPHKNFIFGIYNIIESNEFKLIYYSKIKDEYNNFIYFNDDIIIIDYGLFIEDITLNDENEIKLIVGGEVVFSTIF